MSEQVKDEEVSAENRKEEYVCSACGDTVVPEEHPTDKGVRYRCPSCGKFMKPLTPEDLEDREEESREPLPPPQVLATQRVKEILVKELPRVYGIPKKDATKTITAITDTLTSASIMDPWSLHSHIKDFAPNANDRHLESIIEKIFDQLREEGYLPRDQEGYRVRYDRRRAIDRYRPGYAPREKRRYDEEDYEDLIERSRFRMELAEERRRQEEHELRMKRLEAEILKITRETGGNPQTGLYEETREFIDAEGNLCAPEKAVSVRIKRTPIETKGGLTAEEVRRIVREGKEEITPEKIRDIFRSESSRGESEEVKVLKAELGESRKSIEDLRGTIEAKDRQALLDKVSGLERTVSDLASAGIGEWKSDEIRLIKSGISDIKDIVKTYLSGERPLDRAERIITGGPQGGRPPSEMAGEAERGGVIDELRKHGLVTRIVERRNPGNGSSPIPEPPTLNEKRVPTGVRDSNPELLTQIREQGVLTVLEEKFPRVKEIRQTRFLGRPASESEREPKEPVGEETDLPRGKTGSDTRTEDHIGVVT